MAAPEGVEGHGALLEAEAHELEGVEEDPGAVGEVTGLVSMDEARGGRGGWGEWGCVQHAIRLVPSQLVLDIDSRLRLDHETDQTDAQKEGRVCVFLLRLEECLRVCRASTPHRRATTKRRVGWGNGGTVSRATSLIVRFMEQWLPRTAILVPVIRGASLAHLVGLGFVLVVVWRVFERLWVAASPVLACP